MKNKNDKGFLLIETLVTTCIIAALSTSIYVYVSKTINNYERSDKYDNIVEVYKTNSIKLYLYKKWNSINDITSPTNITDSVLSKVKDELEITSAIICQNNKENIQNLISTTDNNDFKKYMRLLSFTGNPESLRLIIHFSNNTFSSLELKKPDSGSMI